MFLYHLERNKSRLLTQEKRNISIVLRVVSVIHVNVFHLKRKNLRVLDSREKTYFCCIRLFLLCIHVFSSCYLNFFPDVSDVVILLVLFLLVLLSSCSLMLFLGVPCQAVVLSLPLCKSCQNVVFFSLVHSVRCENWLYALSRVCCLVVFVLVFCLFCFGFFLLVFCLVLVRCILGVFFLLYVVKLLFLPCFFMLCVKMLLRIKFIVYAFVFDDVADYNVADFLNFLMVCVKFLFFTIFFNVIVFGTSNVAKLIMLLVLLYRWNEPS